MAGINYAEERAYWYLRLNGFLLITNFVVHKSPVDSIYEPHIENNRDVDIIGVRMQHVYEEIGGNEEDFDKTLISQCGYNSYKELGKPLAIICEVKSGIINNKRELNIGMNEEYPQTKTVVESALRRIGICSPEKINECIGQLKSNKFCDMGDFAVTKILFSMYSSNYLTNCCEINLDYAREFILKRILKYIDSKQAGRMFFPSLQLQDNIDLISAMRRNEISSEEVEKIISMISNNDDSK